MFHRLPVPSQNGASNSVLGEPLKAADLHLGFFLDRTQLHPSNPLVFGVKVEP
jgi:hypothetical protein